MGSLGGCAALAVYIILARNLIGNVNSKMLHLSVAEYGAVVGLAVNGRRAAHNGRVLNDSLKDVQIINPFGLLLESDEVLLFRIVPALDRGDPIVVFYCLFVAAGPRPNLDCFGSKSIEVDFESDFIGLLPIVAHVVLLTQVDGSALIT
jgi:hypothetical protein